jgi:hypothetical protein
MRGKRGKRGNNNSFYDERATAPLSCNKKNRKGVLLSVPAKRRSGVRLMIRVCAVVVETRQADHPTN